MSYPIPLLTRFLYQFFMEFFSNTWCKLLNYEFCLSILFICDMWFHFKKKKKEIKLLKIMQHSNKLTWNLLLPLSQGIIFFISLNFKNVEFEWFIEWHFFLFHLHIPKPILRIKVYTPESKYLCNVCCRSGTGRDGSDSSELKVFSLSDAKSSLGSGMFWVSFIFFQLQIKWNKLIDGA